MIGWIVLFFWIGVGIIDLILVVLHEETISQRVQALMPTWLDMIIFISGCILMFHLWSDEMVTVDKIITLVVWSHLLWPQRERYKTD